jgi:hypothetical protein
VTIDAQSASGDVLASRLGSPFIEQKEKGFNDTILAFISKLGDGENTICSGFSRMVSWFF